MKKILLFLITICAFASMNTAKAQCTIDIANVGITKVAGPITNGGDCRYTFDASFDIIANNGFKYLFFHTWKAADHLTPSFNCGSNSSQDIPTSATLGTAKNSPNKSFMDFGFIGLGDLTITSTQIDITNKIATAYPAGGGVILNDSAATAKVFRKGTSDTLHFDIKNITVFVYGTCGPLGALSTDIWGSNSNSGVPKAQCYICGRLQNFDNPGLSLQKTCAPDPLTGKSANQWEVGLQNSPAAPVNVIFKVYIDKDNDNNKEPLTTDDTLIYTSNVIALGAGAFQGVGPVELPYPYCCLGPWAYYGIYVTAQVVGDLNITETQIIKQGCATLPIKLRSFDAVRNRSNVDLKWVTEIEDNNKGFFIERKISEGIWVPITFVASQATNGNSKSPLTYVLSDLNNTKGISQYRLRQVDIDGKEAYSMIRAVRGEGQKSNTIIYPNPSGDGKVNIVFEGANSIRDVSLMDVSGKTLKQWKGVTNNNIHIDNLNAGFYTVRIVNTETGEQVVEKFIVNKR